jgi:hypothetical protein
MKEIFNFYEYELYLLNGKWKYRIYDIYCKNKIIGNGIDSYESRQRSRFAAIGHITLLEEEANKNGLL